jgi:hypothetical protein
MSGRSLQEQLSLSPTCEQFLHHAVQPAKECSAGLQAEADRLIFEDFDPVNGFMIHPDLKWVSSMCSAC